MATPARATLITITTTGTIDSGNDSSGVFGAAGADLTGRAYTLALGFDSLGKFVNTGAASATTSGAISGSVFVTIGGITFKSLIVRSFGALLSEDRANIYASNDGDDGAATSISVTNALSAATNVFAIGLTKPFSYVAQPADAGFNAGLVQFSASTFSGAGANFAFTGSPTSIAGTVAVPEPMSLAILAVGLGALGLARPSFTGSGIRS